MDFQLHWRGAGERFLVPPWPRVKELKGLGLAGVPSWLCLFGWATLPTSK